MGRDNARLQSELKSTLIENVITELMSSVYICVHWEVCMYTIDSVSIVESDESMSIELIGFFTG